MARDAWRHGESTVKINTRRRLVTLARLALLARLGAVRGEVTLENGCKDGSYKTVDIMTHMLAAVVAFGAQRALARDVSLLTARVTGRTT